MSWLVLDPTGSEQDHMLTISIVGSTKPASKKVLLRQGGALRAIQQMVGKHKVEGIAVVNGVGSFTDVRLTTAIANTLALLWDVPVETSPKSKSKKFKAFVAPKYSGKPNISKPMPRAFRK